MPIGNTTRDGHRGGTTFSLAISVVAITLVARVDSVRAAEDPADLTYQPAHHEFSGSTQYTFVDKDLRQCVAEGAFREDLYYRLNVVPIEVPPLRERTQDIPLLVNFFVRRLCEKNNLRTKHIDDEVMWGLQRHRWPGNVRELQNAVERALIMSGERVTVRDLPEEVLMEDESSGRTGASALKEFRDSAERDFIIAALKRNHGNISQSAAELGVGRTYLHRRLAVLKITKKDFF